MDKLLSDLKRLKEALAEKLEVRNRRDITDEYTSSLYYGEHEAAFLYDDANVPDELFDSLIELRSLLPSLISRLEQADEMERLCRWLLNKGSFFHYAIEGDSYTIGDSAPHSERYYDFATLEHDLKKLFPPAPTKEN